MKLLELFEDINTENALGKPIHYNPSKIINFWKWFGNSKVIDNQNRPLVLYHGTGSDILAFKDKDLNIPNTDHVLDIGIHFSSNVNPANKYALNVHQNDSHIRKYSSETSSEKHPTVYPVYLKIEKLCDLTKPLSTELLNNITSLAKSVGIESHLSKIQKNKQMVLTILSIIQRKAGRSTVKQLFKHYDGIKYQLLGSDCYVIFNRKNIKSAIGNNGNFSDSVNIHESYKPLFEAINIKHQDILKIKNALIVARNKFGKSKNYKKITETFESFLNPIIKNILDNYIDEPFKISLKFFPRLPHHGAAHINSEWSTFKDGTWFNVINLLLLPNYTDFNDSYINDLSSLISHELTHLIQSFKSSKKSTFTKDFKSSDAYYGDKTEIEAYAQSIVSSIMLQSPSIEKVKNIIKHVSQPSNSMEDDMDNTLYFRKKYKQIFGKNLNIDDIKVWKRLNKRIISKLLYYIENYNASSDNIHESYKPLFEIAKPSKPDNIKKSNLTKPGTQGSKLKIVQRSFTTDKGNIVKIQFEQRLNDNNEKSVDIVFYVNDNMKDDASKISDDVPRDHQILSNVFYVIFDYLNSAKINHCTFTALSTPLDTSHRFNVPMGKYTKRLLNAIESLKHDLNDQHIINYLNDESKKLEISQQHLSNELKNIPTIKTISLSLQKLSNELNHPITEYNKNIKALYYDFLKLKIILKNIKSYEMLMDAYNDVLKYLESYLPSGAFIKNNRRFSVYYNILNKYYSNAWNIKTFGDRFELDRK